jgi:hypothetical protein
MEAVMAALFLDGGLEPVRAFAGRWVMGEAAEQLAQELRSGAALGNYKSALQEHLQAARTGTPVYKVKSESGPDHRKRFLVEVRLKADEGEPGKPLARGMGSTKKHAEQDAARRALDRLTATRPKRRPSGRAQTRRSKRRNEHPCTVPGTHRLQQSFRAAAPSAHRAGGIGLAAADGGGGAVSAHFVLQPYLIPQRAWSTRCWWEIFCW